MTEEELLAHHQRVLDRADATKEDRALLVLERTQEGRLERQTLKVWAQQIREAGQVTVAQVAEMLEALRYEISNNEVHFLLHQFGATEGYDMIPERELTQHEWLWLVGECQILKESYKHVSREDWEAAYAKHVQKLTLQDPSVIEASEGEAAWWWTAGEKAGHAAGLKKFAWGMQPEIEAELLQEMELFIGPRIKDREGVQQSMETELQHLEDPDQQLSVFVKHHNKISPKQDHFKMLDLSVQSIIALQTALLIFLQFGDKALPSLFAARKACHAGSGALMLLLDSRDPLARIFVYCVVVSSLAMTWRLVPKWVPSFRFGDVYDVGISVYLLIVFAWFYLQQPVAALAPLFFADPAGAVVGKFCSKRGFNRAWFQNKTIMGTLAVLVVAYLSLDAPGYGRFVLAFLCAMAEAFGGKTFDNAIIAIPVLIGWVYYHGWR
eukprot:symbB.v1.2.020629.t1/scaffold1744.1/size103388/4